MTTSWQPTTLVQCISLKPWLTYPGCDEPGGCHDLTLGRIYEMLGVEAKGSFYRILDDSGEDYLYPGDFFVPLELAQSAEAKLDALVTAESGAT